MEGGCVRPLPRPWCESLLLCALDEEWVAGVCPAEAEGLRMGMTERQGGGGRVCGTRSSVRESETWRLGACCLCNEHHWGVDGQRRYSYTSESVRAAGK